MNKISRQQKIVKSNDSLELEGICKLTFYNKHSQSVSFGLIDIPGGKTLQIEAAANGVFTKEEVDINFSTGEGNLLLEIQRIKPCKCKPTK